MTPHLRILSDVVVKPLSQRIPTRPKVALPPFPDNARIVSAQGHIRMACIHVSVVSGGTMHYKEKRITITGHALVLVLSRVAPCT